MTFGDALLSLWDGYGLSRTGWNGSDQYIRLRRPDQKTNVLPYLYITVVTGNRVPWVPSQTDMLADDWIADDISKAISGE